MITRFLLVSLFIIALGQYAYLYKGNLAKVREKNDNIDWFYPSTIGGWEGENHIHFFAKKSNNDLYQITKALVKKSGVHFEIPITSNSNILLSKFDLDTNFKITNSKNEMIKLLSDFKKKPNSYPQILVDELQSIIDVEKNNKDLQIQYKGTDTFLFKTDKVQISDFVKKEITIYLTSIQNSSPDSSKVSLISYSFAQPSSKSSSKDCEEKNLLEFGGKKICVPCLKNALVGASISGKKEISSKLQKDIQKVLTETKKYGPEARKEIQGMLKKLEKQGVKTDFVKRVITNKSKKTGSRGRSSKNGSHRGRKGSRGRKIGSKKDGKSKKNIKRGSKTNRGSKRETKRKNGSQKGTQGKKTVSRGNIRPNNGKNIVKSKGSKRGSKGKKRNGSKSKNGSKRGRKGSRGTKGSHRGRKGSRGRKIGSKTSRVTKRNSNNKTTKRTPPKGSGSKKPNMRNQRNQSKKSPNQRTTPNRSTNSKRSKVTTGRKSSRNILEIELESKRSIDEKIQIDLEFMSKLQSKFGKGPEFVNKFGNYLGGVSGLDFAKVLYDRVNGQTRETAPDISMDDQLNFDQKIKVIIGNEMYESLPNISNDDKENIYSKFDNEIAKEKKILVATKQTYQNVKKIIQTKEMNKATKLKRKVNTIHHQYSRKRHQKTQCCRRRTSCCYKTLKHHSGVSYISLFRRLSRRTRNLIRNVEHRREDRRLHLRTRNLLRRLQGRLSRIISSI